MTGTPSILDVQYGEEWRPLSFDSLYEVSSKGRVASWKPFRNNSPHPSSRRILSMTKDKDGYNKVLLTVDGSNKTCRVCRLVAETFLGSREGMVVRHVDGSKDNDCVENLVWGTHKENSQDAKNHGTWVHGQKVNTCVLTEECVSEIKRSGLSLTKLAKIYGVSIGTIWHIKDGRTWKHVTD